MVYSWKQICSYRINECHCIWIFRLITNDRRSSRWYRFITSRSTFNIALYRKSIFEVVLIYLITRRSCRLAIFPRKTVKSIAISWPAHFNIEKVSIRIMISTLHALPMLRMSLPSYNTVVSIYFKIITPVWKARIQTTKNILGHSFRM